MCAPLLCTTLVVVPPILSFSTGPHSAPPFPLICRGTIHRAPLCYGPLGLILRSLFSSSHSHRIGFSRMYLLASAYSLPSLNTAQNNSAARCHHRPSPIPFSPCVQPRP